MVEIEKKTGFFSVFKQLLHSLFENQRNIIAFLLTLPVLGYISGAFFTQFFAFFSNNPIQIPFLRDLFASFVFGLFVFFLPFVLFSIFYLALSPFFSEKITK